MRYTPLDSNKLRCTKFADVPCHVIINIMHRTHQPLHSTTVMTLTPCRCSLLKPKSSFHHRFWRSQHKDVIEIDPELTMQRIICQSAVKGVAHLDQLWLLQRARWSSGCRCGCFRKHDFSGDCFARGPAFLLPRKNKLEREEVRGEKKRGNKEKKKEGKEGAKGKKVKAERT